MWAYQNCDWDKCAVRERGTNKVVNQIMGGLHMDFSKCRILTSSLPPGAAVQLKYINSLTRCILIVTCHLLIGFWYESASNWFITVSVQSNRSANDNLYLQLLPALASPPQLHLRSSGIRYSLGACNLDSSHVRFTVGFMLLRESVASPDLTGGRAQMVIWAMGSGCKYRWSFTCLSPTRAHLLLCGPVPNRPRTGTDLKPWGLEPLL